MRFICSIDKKQIVIQKQCKYYTNKARSKGEQQHKHGRILVKKIKEERGGKTWVQTPFDIAVEPVF